MSDNLIIVESPTKAKTIGNFLGKGYIVESSYGHVRDLPKSKMGVDIEHDFAPAYIIPVKAKKRAGELKKLAAKAKTIYYATDEDREGEAISWHLDELFGHPKNSKRIAFHEITKIAIENALNNPRELDVNLVNAQQARRILDRLVGYELSPFLWKKVAKGLSAGRVQSVAVRLIVDRERQIQAFNKEEYWTIEAVFSKDNVSFEAVLHSLNKEKLEKFSITAEEQAVKIVKAINNNQFTVAKVEQKRMQKTPPTPFTTSTLQQRANRGLGFSAKQTMVLAQQLYEGIALGSRGQVGLITYMRTDSLNLAEQFLVQVQTLIKEKFGSEYARGVKRYQAKSKLAQEAHEAIRPTNPELTPESVKKYLDSRQFRLYDLIWRRTVGSQMPPAEILNTAVDLDDEQGHLFRANGAIITFDGFLKVLPYETGDKTLPVLKEGENVKTEKVKPLQHFTEPPPRYTEASLIKALEEYGIGRPSTYAPTIATIENRNYVVKEEKKLKPTDIGFIVNDLLVEHFPNIVDYTFTARVEDEFDKIALGEEDWVKMIKGFYWPFHENISAKQESVSKDEAIGSKELGLDPVSGKPISVKIGRFGPYVQKGSKEDTEKPAFASLKKEQSIQTITLEEALELLSLPRILGADESGEAISANNGRFGPYIKVGSNYFSLKGADFNPYTISLDQALGVIKEGLEKKANKIIKEFSNSDVKILNGRYGAYITNGKKNGKIPKDVEPGSLTLEECEEILKNAPERGKGRRWGKKS